MDQFAILVYILLSSIYDNRYTDFNCVNIPSRFRAFQLSLRLFVGFGESPLKPPPSRERYT